MRDRIWMLLALIGFCLLAYIVTINYDSNDEGAMYDVGVYVPEVRTDLTNSKTLYEQLQGSRRITCPVVSPPSPQSGAINMSSIYGSYNTHKYNMSYMFIGKYPLYGDNPMSTLTADNWSSVLKINNTAASSIDPQTIEDLFDGDQFSSDEDFIEIISPFSFIFGNVNSGSIEYLDNGAGNKNLDSMAAQQSIVILNAKSTCRITFTDVANWFCAGEVGTFSTGGSGKNEQVDWVLHYKYHHSTIGKSPNAVCTGGGPGIVIGYAKKTTTVKIEVWTGSSWETISLNALIAQS